MKTARFPIVLALLTGWIGTSFQAGASSKEAMLDPSARLLRDASLMLLKEGNSRYTTGRSQHPHLDAERRSTTVAQGQEPFATILACSDSRDPVELLFDRGVGDLFVVRVAGNVAGPSELATVEYGVGHLNTPLLVVMGHSKCGAVTAVVKGASWSGHFAALAEHIRPAVAKAKAETADLDEAVPKAIQANVWQTIEDIIKESSVVRERLAAGRVTIMGAVYDLEQGKVAWLGVHPAQESLVALAEQAQTDPALARKLAAEAGHAPLSTPPSSAATASGHGTKGSPANSPAATRRPLPPLHAPDVAHEEHSESVVGKR
jgi:carbonic anhydrase